MKYLKLFDNYSEFQPLWDKLHQISQNSNIIEKYEEDYDKLMSRGELFEDYSVEIIKGEQSRCHQNCAIFIDGLDEDSKPYYEIATGWALLNNEWQQHSWIIDVNGIIIETTIDRDKYFGFILNVYETVDFIDDNL